MCVWGTGVEPAVDMRRMKLGKDVGCGKQYNCPLICIYCAWEEMCSRGISLVLISVDFVLQYSLHIEPNMAWEKVIYA